MKFEYLKSEQALKLFKKECEILNLNVSKSATNLISSLNNLAPGDFRAVINSNKFYPIKNSDEFAKRLFGETKHKKDENSYQKVGLLGRILGNLK